MDKGGDKVGEKGGRFVADNFHQRRCCAGTVAYCKEGNFIVKAYKAFNDNLSASCASAFLLVLIIFFWGVDRIRLSNVLVPYV